MGSSVWGVVLVVGVDGVAASGITGVVLAGDGDAGVGSGDAGVGSGDAGVGSGDDGGGGVLFCTFSATSSSSSSSS